MDDYPGIEIRVTRYKDDGPEIIFEGDSHLLHFQLMSMWLHAGFAGDSWYPIRGGYMLGELLLEIRAVTLPELAAAPDCPADLFRGQAGSLAELAQLERAAAGRIAERAAAAESCCVCGFPRVDYRNYRDDPFCGPCANGDPVGGYCNATPDGHAWPVCALELGHEPATHESADFYWSPGDAEPRLKAYRPGHDAAPVPPFPGGDTGAVDPGAGPDLLTERGQSTGPTRRRLRAGSAIVRIARRALSLSGR